MAATRRGTAGSAGAAPEPRVARALEARRRRLAAAPAPYVPPSLDEVRARLDALLAARWPEAGPVRALDFLTGGASKQHFAFEVEERSAAGPRRRALVLRTALAESLGTAPDFQREFEV